MDTRLGVAETDMFMSSEVSQLVLLCLPAERVDNRESEVTCPHLSGADDMANVLQSELDSQW